MAGSVVLSAIQWIGSLLLQEGRVLCKVKDQVQNLQEELEIMQLYLQDADVRQEEREIGALISQIRKLAYDAEDVIDTYILKVQARVELSNRRWLLRHACLLYNAPHIYEVCQCIEVIQSSLKRVTEKFNSYGVRRTPGILRGDLRLPLDERYRGQKPQSFPYDDDDSKYVVGWENDIAKLVQVLMGEGMNQISFLSIVGMGGSGKTTLARKLYNHPYIKECFNCTAWVFISQEWSTQDILSQIYRKVGGSKDLLHASTGELVDELRHILKKKSYLIVLDDVWRREALEEILPALPRGNINRGSKVVITTRNLEITQFSIPKQNQYTYEPQPLSEEEAWELFSKIVLSHNSTFNTGNYGNLAKEMLKKCDGLPLAIVALCGILNTKCSINEWQQVNEAVRLRVMDGTTTHMYGRVGDLLALSYDDLPYYLKSCFLYLGVFPEDCQIPTGMLTRMWIAEGLITTHEGMSPEDVAIQRLEELSHRFLVQIARTNFKGEIKAIRLHDLLRDLCVKKAKEQSFLEIYAPMDCLHSSGVPQFIEPRRSALHASVTFPTQVSHLRSITMLTRSSVSYSAYASKETLDLQVVYNNFKLLRLLNLWGIKTANGTLPTEIGSLLHLRYLGIRASNITELPASIGNLRNLLMLDYRNVDSNNSLPIKIPKALGKLVLLRHLFLPIECPWSVEDLPLSAMKNLRTLWGVKQGAGGNWLSREVADLSRTLKKLKIVVSTQTELARTFNLLSNINGLRTFHCEMRDGVALQWADPISKHQQLHKLIIIGEIQMKLDLILPCNLVMLELKDSILNNEDPMAAIGAMQHLKLLRMSNSYLRTTFTCKRGSFPQLEELYLANLENLEEWTIEMGSMLCLKKLEILRCGELSCFPKGLLFVTTLQELEYFGMPKKFSEQANECGWTQNRFRLPDNYEAIIEQCDSLVDTSSISKIYKQLTVGIYLNRNLEKYWVVKHEDRYYNYFMFYSGNLFRSPCGRILVDEYDLALYLDSWEWSTIPESDGTLVSVVQMKRSSHFSEFGSPGNLSTRNPTEPLGDLSTRNLSLGITYEIAYVVMFLEGTYPTPISAAVSNSLYGARESHQHTLHNKPRDEWIRLLAGRLEISESTSAITLFLEGMVPGMLIKGVIVEPMF